MDSKQAKNTRRGFRQGEKTLRAIFEASPVGIMLMQQRIMEKVNPALCEMLGYARQELEGRNTRMLYLSEEDYTKAGIMAYEHKKFNGTNRMEANWLRKDGEKIDVYLQVRSLDASGPDQGYIVIAEDITYRKRTEKQVKENQDKLRQLALEVTRVEEQERQRLAETVHDGLGQTLALLRILLQSVLATHPRKRDAGLHELVGLVDQAIKEAREVTAELSPPVLRELGLNAGLAWLASHTFQRYGIVTRFRCDWKSMILDQETALLLYRVTHELVTNAVKHGQPSFIDIILAHRDHHLEITVQDDGEGFEVSSLATYLPRGFGLFSIKERINSLSGRVKIGSRPGVGTVVRISVPLKNKPNLGAESCTNSKR